MKTPQRSIPVSVLLVAFCVLLPGLAVAEDDGAAGQEAFIAAKCNLCHGVAALEIEQVTKSEKMAGPDLSGIGNKRETDWMIAFIKREETTEEGGKHTKPFKGTDEELAVIVEWMSNLVDEAGSDQEASADN